MEHAPKGPESMTVEQIEERLAEIDRLKFSLSENLNRVAEGIEESRQGDDNATEYESVDPRLGTTRFEREALDKEATLLRERLAELKKAA